MLVSYISAVEFCELQTQRKGGAGKGEQEQMGL